MILGARSPAQAENGRIGLMLDAGLPDGVNGSLVWRMTPRIRAHAGVSHNGISPGVRAGIGIAAFPYWITPTATLEAGHYFVGDASALAQRLSGDPELNDPILQAVGYDYANAHVGLELGYASMTFYIHAGMSVLQMTVRNLDESLAPSDEEMDGPRIEVRGDPSLRVIAPSARTGFIYYF